MSLDEPESTDRNTPLGKQPWHTNTGLSTLSPAADLNIVDVVSAIDIVEDVISADVDDDLIEAVDDDDDLVVTSVISTTDTAAAGDGVDCVTSIAEVIVSVEPVMMLSFRTTFVILLLILYLLPGKGKL